MQEVIMTGKTVDEAVEAACAALGLSRDEVSVEVIDMPQRRLFGSSPAKVRVYLNEEDDAFSVKALLRGETPLTPEKGSKPVNLDAADKKETRPAEGRIPAEKAETRPTEIRVAAEKAAPEETRAAEPETPEEPAVPIAIEALPLSAKAALTYLQDVAEKMQAKNLEYKAFAFDGGVNLSVDGEDAAILIGRRGETMDALQYLCLLVSNRSGGEYCKISIDVAGYRKKREKTLEALAKRVAVKVQKSRRSQTLEPMNPYERRIVHSAIQGIAGVKSESVGEDPHRRVVVLPEGERLRPYGGGNRDRDRGGRPGPRGPRQNDLRPARPPRPAPVEPAVKPAAAKPAEPGTEKNLYGKIEF